MTTRFLATLVAVAWLATPVLAQVKIGFIKIGRASCRERVYVLV